MHSSAGFGSEGRAAGAFRSTYLFSVDLEDIRARAHNGERYRERVPEMVDHYLGFLSRTRARCTFFTVGDVARRYPELIRRIVAMGHEIASHSSQHTPLDEQDATSFRDDLRRNVDELTRAGSGEIVGFRAPLFSVTERTCWAYEVLEELGFRYSSSVLPARNPRYGWPGFGADCRRFGSVWELPLSVTPLPGLKLPFAGGVYFRLLPLALIRLGFRWTASRRRPVVGYFHPYDIDTEQERFAFPELGDSRLYNALMYLGRGHVLDRLKRLVTGGPEILPYRDFVEQRLR